MSHLMFVVLVIAVCWFSVALVAGVALGTLMRRASTLALMNEGGHRIPGIGVSVPARRSVPAKTSSR